MILIKGDFLTLLIEAKKLGLVDLEQLKKTE